MTEKLEYSAADMASAAAGGWRDGQRAAAEAARAAPDEVFAIPVRENGKRTTIYTEVLPFVPGPGVEVLGEPVRMVAAQSAPAGEREAYEHWKAGMEPYGFGGLDAFQAGAAWQRTQASGVPEGWRVERRELDGSVCFIIGSPRIVGVRSNTSVWESDSDPAHLLLWHMLAAAPAQPAVQVEQQPAAFAVKSPNTGKTRLYARSKAHLMPGFANAGYIVTPLVERDAPIAQGAQPEVQRLREALRWRQIESDPPAVGQCVVLSGPQGADRPGRYWRLTGIRREDGYYDSNGCGCNDATHWHELLESPGAMAALAASTGKEVE